MSAETRTYTVEEARALVASHPWWYHRFEVHPGVVTPGVYDPSSTLIHGQATPVPAYTHWERDAARCAWREG